MNTYARSSALAAALIAALSCATPLSAQSSAKKRTPPATSDAAPQARKPPAQPPPAQAVPRPTPPERKPPPAPPHTPPHAPPPRATYLYPFVPFIDFDFVYRFPYGVYPYSRYGYPYPPYRFVFPPPGCVASEIEAHGSLRLDVPQREATVSVDGFYAGVVDDFNGVTGHLNLKPGPHHIELRLPGYETVAFDVNIEPGRTIAYRTPMLPAGSPATPRP